MLLALPMVLLLQGGGFPQGPLSPLSVASGGSVAATSSVGALSANPAAGAWVHGIELSYVTFPRTGLRGLGTAASAGGRVSVLAAAWSYRISDVIDPELVAADQSLAGLGASGSGASVGIAARAGGLSVAMSTSLRSLDVVGAHQHAGSFSGGAMFRVPHLDFGVAWLDAPWGRRGQDVAPVARTVAGVAGTLPVGKDRSVRLEVDAEGQQGRRLSVPSSGALSIRLGGAEIIVGRRMGEGWSLGGALTWGWGRLDMGGAPGTVGNLDQRFAGSVTLLENRTRP